MSFFTFKKLGRTLALSAVLAVGAACWSGCGENEDGGGDDSATTVDINNPGGGVSSGIVNAEGEAWVRVLDADYSQGMIFKQNGEYVVIYKQGDSNWEVDDYGTYSVNGSSLILNSASSGEVAVICNITGNTAKVTIGDGEVLTYTKTNGVYIGGNNTGGNNTGGNNTGGNNTGGNNTGGNNGGGVSSGLVNADGEAWVRVLDADYSQGMIFKQNGEYVEIYKQGGSNWVVGDYGTYSVNGSSLILNGARSGEVAVICNITGNTAKITVGDGGVLTYTKTNGVYVGGSDNGGGNNTGGGTVNSNIVNADGEAWAVCVNDPEDGDFCNGYIFKANGDFIFVTQEGNGSWEGVKVATYSVSGNVIILGVDYGYGNGIVIERQWTFNISGSGNTLTLFVEDGGEWVLSRTTGVYPTTITSMYKSRAAAFPPKSLLSWKR